MKTTRINFPPSWRAPLLRRPRGQGDPGHGNRSLASAVAALLLAVAPGRAATLYVDLNNASPTPPYTTWATAATVIQTAVDAAAAGDDIVVSNGVYQVGATAVSGISNRVAVTKAVRVQSVHGPAVTTIVGYQVPDTTNGPAAVRCVYLAEGAVLAGFTLTQGATLGNGGGVWCASDGAWVTNCVLTGNSASQAGGGAYQGTLNNCTLTGNSADYSGGGASEGRLNNCIVYYNTAVLGGANYSGGTFSYCCTTPLPASGPGNLDTEPLLASASHLSAASTCRGAGSAAYTNGQDIDGEPWANPPRDGVRRILERGGHGRTERGHRNGPYERGGGIRGGFPDAYRGAGERVALGLWRRHRGEQSAVRRACLGRGGGLRGGVAGR